jgi:hypothetical protein
MKSLNVYSPETPQGDAIIIGSHKGLIALKQAIERVLDEGLPVFGRSHVVIEDKIQEPFTHEFYKDDEGMRPQEVLDELLKSNIEGINPQRRKLRWK